MDYFSKINFLNQYLISKQDVLESLKNYIKHCEKTNEEGWSENKRQVILNVLYKFLGCIQNMRFPEIKSSDWFYDYIWKADGIVLELQHCDKVEFDENGELISAECSECVILAEVKCAYLTVEEYAKKYDVTVTAVRQWIRRGKLRCAMKMGRDWLIPELADRPQRGYEPASYQWEYLSENLVKEFPFLKECFQLHIMKSDMEKGWFDVILLNKYGRAYDKIHMNIKEREKLELALISETGVTAKEWFQDIIYVPAKDTKYYLQGEKVMFEEEIRKYEKTMNILEENDLEIHTNNHLYNEDGMFIWGFSAELCQWGEDWDEEESEEIVSLSGGIVIPAESEFLSGRGICYYSSAAELCDSMSGDMIAAYSTVGEVGEGIKLEILKELDLQEEDGYESSILYINDIFAKKMPDLKMFLEVFEVVCQGIPADNCRLAIYLINWEQESEKAKVFLECGWKMKSIDEKAVIAYRKM